MSSKNTTTKSRKRQTKRVRAKKSSSSKNLHVLPRDDRWAVVVEGGSRAIVVFDTQVEATEAARKIAKVRAGQLIVHGRGGRIRLRDYYGHDPLPPRVPRKVLHPGIPPRSKRRDAISKAVTEAVRETKSAA